MAVTLYPYLYEDSEELTRRLEAFLQKPDIAAKLEAAVHHIFPDNASMPKPAYGLTALHLKIFGLSDADDHHPYNYAAAILQAAQGARADDTMPRIVNEGLQGVANQLRDMVAKAPDCPLKQEIQYQIMTTQEKGRGA